MAVTTKYLASTAVRGVQWTTVATVLRAALQPGYAALTTRLLNPATFGLVATAGVVLRFGSCFAGMGCGRTLVPRIDIATPNGRATFTASLGLGRAMAGVAGMGTPLAVFFLKDAAVTPLLQVLSGPRWAASVPVLRALCLAVSLIIVMLLVGVGPDARANLHQKIILNIEFIVLLAGLLWLLKGYGLAGIAGAIGTGEVVRTFLSMRITHRAIGIPPLLALLATGAAVLSAVRQHWPSAALRPLRHQALGRLRGIGKLPATAQQGLARYATFLKHRPGLFAAFDEFDQPLVS